jgi:hypothetical protein
MVNHVRTLLLNRPARTTTPAGEYVPPEARELTLPAYLVKVRAQLFGARPDAAMLDFRLRQYTALLHATALKEFLTIDDPRITYTPGGRDPGDFPFRPAVSPIGHSQPLYLGGGELLARNGQMVHEWLVEVSYSDPISTRFTAWDLFMYLLVPESSDSVDPVTTVRVDRRRPVPSSALYAIDYVDALSNEFPLAGAPLWARFSGVGLESNMLWTVRCLGRPETDLGEIEANLAALGGDVMLRLFGEDPGEPQRTWKALWASQQPLAYRLGAVLLAVAWRTDQLRGKH